MKTFLVIFKEKCKQPLDGQLLKKHVAYLKQLTQENHLLICGPFVDGSGAMLILQAECRLNVVKLIQSDPFIQNKFYSNYAITEFYKADNANNFLMDPSLDHHN